MRDQVYHSVVVHKFRIPPTCKYYRTFPYAIHEKTEDDLCKYWEDRILTNKKTWTLSKTKVHGLA